MPNVLVFDVNETLLDLAALDPEFERVFGSASVRPLWFSQFIQNALISIVTDSYEPFGAIGGAALEQVAARRGLAISSQDRIAIMSGMSRLAPHVDVPNALARLRDAGFRMCALTNSVQSVADSQLTHAALAHFFEHIFSADTVKRLKPSREPYAFAAREMGAPISEMWMIAAHAWDVTGAQRAGARAAFIARPGAALDPLAPRPQVIGRDLNEVADKLINLGLW